MLDSLQAVTILTVQFAPTVTLSQNPDCFGHARIFNAFCNIVPCFRNILQSCESHVDCNIFLKHGVIQTLCLRLIDEERESNAVNKTGKGSTGYRKRSVSHHQSGYSGSISNIYPTYDQVASMLLS